MKLLHISDLHIGSRVNEFSMLEDQSILNEILRIAKEQKVDGILAAGDIYDKSVPRWKPYSFWMIFLRGQPGLVSCFM